MAGETSNSPNKASLRRVVRSGLANRKAADRLLDAIDKLQATYNALLAKLDLDVGVADLDYKTLLAVDELDPDA